LPKLGLHHLFELQARQRPEQLAVISAGKHLTYQQVNEQANRLASVLRRRNVGPNALVAICMTRSPQMIVGMLSILKAGGAYLPLDPATPPVRLTSQLQGSGAQLLLSEQECCPYLPAWAGTTICLEELESELSLASAKDISVPYEAEHLAYVISTSGSTGQPKGVMVRQSSVVNYTLALCEQLGAQPGWQYATVSTLAADLGNTSIFCALASGGCVQVLDRETISSTAAMASWVEQHPIDVLKIVPSHLSALLEGQQAQTVLPRRALICGGETLPVSLLERIHELEGS
jgi:non-ribosomal peptide synthetase component F